MLTPSALEAFAEQLRENGVTAKSVEQASKAGGDHEIRSSKWKTYYRSAAFPTSGVLLAYETEDASIADLLDRLTQESTNFDLLREAGHVVPIARPTASVVLDHLADGRPAAALVVEHIAGRGPFKGIYPKSFMGVVNAMGEPARSVARANWTRLQAAVGRRAPMDLQLMLEPEGRIVVIDCERTTQQPVYRLQDWDDTVRPRVPGAGPSTW